MKKEKKNLMQKATTNWNLVLECIMPPEYWLLALSAILSDTERNKDQLYEIF